jgi:tetratricopeptide (TPR) repeat protein
MPAQDFYESSVARAAEGRLDEALSLARLAAEAQPGSARAHAQVGALLAALYRPNEAIGPLERALSIDPDRPDALNNLGAVWRAQGKIDAARAAFAQAVELEPTYRDAAKNLAGTLGIMGRNDEAIAVLERLIAAGATSPAIYDELGKAFWKSGKTERGIAEFRRALEIDPHYGDAWAHLGNALVEEGRIAESVAAFVAAIRHAPERGEFFRFLVVADPSAVTAEHVAALEVLAARDLPEHQGVEVRFALGKIYAARGDRERSFANLLAANTEARTQLQYDEAATVGAFQQIAGTFDAAYLRERRGTGCQSTLPIFIFGMPRSGTTLVEQILASHPAVYPAGELSLFQDIATDMLGPGGASPREIGERYVCEVAKLAAAAPQRITDKMPANFRYAGLIHLALPNARMIHVRRDPLDTCLSCFSNSFAAADGLAWTYDLGELGRYCRGYLSLMEHWRATFASDAMLEVRYEEVVDDFETQARRIVAYCDLPWDDRCLDFYSTKRPVKTASAAQVRRPIYRTSVRAAQAYGDLLRPLIDALDNPAVTNNSKITIGRRERGPHSGNP